MISTNLRDLEGNSNFNLSFHSMSRQDKAMTVGLLLGGIPLAVGIIFLLPHLHLTQSYMPIDFSGAVRLTAVGGLLFACGLGAAVGEGVRHQRFKVKALDETLPDDDITRINNAINHSGHVPVIEQLTNFDIKISKRSGDLKLIDIYRK